MQTFSDFAAGRKPGGVICYCATGPSLAEAHKYAYLGDVATIGEAGLLIPDRRLSFVFLNNVKRGLASCKLFDRTDHIICPETIHDDESGAKHDVTKLDWLPQDKLIVYKRRKKKIYNAVKRMRTAIANRELAPFAFSVLALLALHLLGYRRILCWGHDGGAGHAKGVLGDDDPSYSYTPRAKQVRKMARIIENQTATRVSFFPDIPSPDQLSNVDATL